MKWKVFFLLFLLVVILFRMGMVINKKTRLPKVELGVTDLSAILRSSTVEKINSQAGELHDKYGDDLLFIVVPDLSIYGGADMFASEVRKRWSRHTKYPDNDLVVVFETGTLQTDGARKGKVHLYMGEGLMLIFPMQELSDLLDRTMVPLVERGLVDDAFLKVADYLYSRLFQIGQKQQEIEEKIQQVVKKQQTRSAKRQQLFNFVVMIGLMVGLYMIVHVARGEPCPECGVPIHSSVEVLKKPTGSRHGLGRKLKSCSYCGYYDLRRFLIRDTRREGKRYQVSGRDWKK